MTDHNLGYLSAQPSRSSITRFPLHAGVEYGSFDTVRLKPGGSMPFYSNGQPGTTITYQLIRVPNTGGHYHGGETSDALAAGTCVPPVVTLVGPWPQNAELIVSAPECCGSIRYRANFNAGEPSVVEILLEVLYDSLMPIPQ